MDISPCLSGASPTDASAPSPSIAKSKTSTLRRRFKQAEHVTKWSNAVWPATKRNKKSAIGQALALRPAQGGRTLLAFEAAPSTYTYPLYTYTYPTCDNVVADLVAESAKLV